MTPIQKKLYVYLLERIDDPVCPSYAEMQKAIGQSSKSGIARLLDALEKRGLVERRTHAVRSVRAVRPAQLDGVSTMALIGELKRRGEWPRG